VDRVLALQLAYPEKRYTDGPPARGLLRRLQEEVGALPGVTATAFASGVPMADGWGRLVTVEGRPQALKDLPFVNHVVVTPGYFRALGIALLRGRDFSGADYDSPNVVVVSDSFSREHWPHGGALGKRIRFGPPGNDEPWHTIVGVVADSRHVQLRGDDRPNVYIPYNREFTPAWLVVRGADPLRLAPAIKARIFAFDRGIALSHTYSLTQLVERASWQERFFAVLSGAFAAVALLLAAAGLYAVLSYTVSLKTHEIGIRMALGSSAGRVRALVLRQGLALAGAGLGLGLLAAFVLTRLLRAQLYATSHLDPAAYLAAAAVLMAAR
jgi:putative ABC transport system permease protein